MAGDFFNMTRGEVAAWCGAQGHPAIHSRALLRAAYKDLLPSPFAASGLPRGLVAAGVALGAQQPRLKVAHRSSYDHSVKFLVTLADGGEVEAVLMPEKRRITLCVSSQVGCAQGCVFCHTGRMGLKRSLTAGEIVGQVVGADQWLRDHPDFLAEAHLPPGQRLTNVVFMGMGEPLDNVEAVISAHGILTDPWGLALGIGRVTISTAGHLPGIQRLLAAQPRARLALSVHSVEPQARSRIMPINRRWPLAEVVTELRRRLGPDGTPVMFQYTMIAGVNDSPAEASRLADLVAGLNAKINLIPLNDIAASRLTAPTPEVIQAFRDVLYDRGIRVMVRYSKGQDIAAACGQLIVERRI